MKQNNLNNAFSPLEKRALTGFSLVELLVGVVVLVIISSSSWFAISTLIRSGEIARNEGVALNLLQKSQEEIRRKAVTFFDNLESCEFSQPDDGRGNPCGFSELSDSFTGFTRLLEIENDQNSSELKRAKFTVTYQDFGKPKQLDSIVLLSRPPEPLPGNIYGAISSAEQPGTLINNAWIEVSPRGSLETTGTRSESFLSPKEANYDFYDFSSNHFVLKPGIWDLLAKHESYMNYLQEGIVVESNQETRVDILMEAKPEDAAIFGDVINRVTTAKIPAFRDGRIYLAEDGANVPDEWTVHSTSYYFSGISFNEPGPRCFTVYTADAFKAGYAYQVGSAGSPSCQFLYNPKGYSTSVIQEDGGLVCSNPWEGGAELNGFDPDRICVDPGEEKRVDLYVQPVAETVIRGVVKDSFGMPVANATVEAVWPRAAAGGDHPWTKTVQSNQNGRFVYSVPAVQGLFANDYAYFLRVRAHRSFDILGCCNQINTETRYSSYKTVGPLFPNDPIRNAGDLVINIEPYECGNVQGTVLDDKNSWAVYDAQVTIRGSSDKTDSSGLYSLDCGGDPATTGYRLPRGESIFQSQKQGYYDYRSDGRNYYYNPRPNVMIYSKQATDYDAKMWPKGFGTITGTVLDSKTGYPVEGVRVILTLYDGSIFPDVFTSSSGAFQFDSVMETWPPPGIAPGDSYYRHDSLNHQIEVIDDNGLYEKYDGTVTGLNDQETLNLDIILEYPRGM